MIDWQESDWPCCSVINSTVSLRILQFSIVHGQNQWKSRKGMEGENRLVYEFIPISRIGTNRRGADGVRVDNFPRIQYVAAQWRSQQFTVEIRRDTREFHRTDHLHVNVQRHCMGRERKRRIVYCEFQNRSRLCKKIRGRTLVVSCARIREEMVRNSHEQAEWKMGSCRWGHDAQLQWKRTSRIPWIQSSGTKKRKIVYTLLWRRQSHFLFPSINSAFTEQ